jgi:hypothetical protein
VSDLNPPRSDRTVLATAALAALAMIAEQIAGKAARDGLFLSHFPVSALPAMVIVAALTAWFGAWISTRVLLRAGPAALVPVGFGASALLHLVEWALVGPLPRTAAVLLFLHIAALTGVLISWFWSLFNESYDPRTARRNVDRVVSGAALGGIAGGLLAVWVAGGSGEVNAVFPLLAALHAVTAAASLPMGSRARYLERRETREPATSAGGWRTLRDVPYLRNLALVVALGTVGAAVLDFVFKSSVVLRYPGGPGLLQFFAVYYTGTSLATFLLQTAGSRRLLERFGSTRTAALLPGGLSLGSLLAAVLPGLGPVVVARGAEATFRNSFFRSAYELFYTPVAPARKRGVKALIDVGAERMGDAGGGALVQIVLFAVPVVATRNLLLGLAVLLGVAVLYFLRRLQSGYIGALESSLIRRKEVLGPEDRFDADRSSLFRSLTGIAVPVLDAPEPASAADGGAPGPPADSALRLRDELRSGNAVRVRGALQQVRSDPELDPTLYPDVVRLLAWDELKEDAIDVLRTAGEAASPHLARALLDPDESFAVRRRLPRILVALPTEATARTLLGGLDDARFEVRYQCARALRRLCDRGVPFPGPTGAILAVVEREVGVDRRVWTGRRLLERLDDADSMFVDEILRKRADRGLEHVFTLLSFLLPPQPLRVAFRGLHTDDPMLRGTALEYLASVLPEAVRAGLWSVLEEGRAPAPATREPRALLDELLQSHASIELQLQEVRKRLE